MAEDLTSVLRRLIDAYTHDMRINPHFRGFASVHDVLPVTGDMGGLMGVSLEGQVITLSHGTGEASLELDPRWRATALREAKRKHPELVGLLPEEPAEPYEYLDREVLEKMFREP